MAFRRAYYSPQNQLPLTSHHSASESRKRLYRAVCKLIVNPSLRTFLIKHASTELPMAKVSWDTKDRRDEFPSLTPSHRLPVFHQEGHDIEFSPDGTRFAVTRLTGDLAIWEYGRFQDHPELLKGCRNGRFAWSFDGRYIAAVVDKDIEIHQLGNVCPDWSLSVSY